MKSFSMPKSSRICSGVLPLIMFAIVLHPTSLDQPKLTISFGFGHKHDMSVTYRSCLMSR